MLLYLKDVASCRAPCIILTLKSKVPDGQNTFMSVKQTYYRTFASLCAGLIDPAVVVPRPDGRAHTDKSTLTK